MAPFPPCRAAVRHGPRFARPGVDIALIARGREALEGARREVASRGARAMTISIDVADHDAVETAADAVEDAFGPIDIWVNDAMVTVFGFFRDIAPAEYRRATEVTYLGTVWGTRAALDRMVPRDRGTIVLVGSAMATAASRCRPRTAARSTPSRGCSSRSAASCATTIVGDQAPGGDRRGGRRDGGGDGRRRRDPDAERPAVGRGRRRLQRPARELRLGVGGDLVEAGEGGADDA